MTRGERRSAARLAAVQGLYQMDLTGKGILEVLGEFETHWIGKEIEGDQYKPAERGLFRAIVQGVLAHQAPLDRACDRILADGWPLKRVEALMRAVLRAGAYELTHASDVPVKVVVSEYVDIAASFLDGEEVGMVNAVLDRLARETRAGELARSS
ncbi:MAG TPA: transcription antitermination factor NusB [Beijerinckiaceae bacterium]|nr:transcription antitermination factor NusB [Beijerinckiaceae bacterium]